MRLFAALALPETVSARLLPLQVGVGGAKWRPREALHITLRFFGDVREDIARDLDEELANVALVTAPFEIALKGAGSFGGADPHALWIGVQESAALRKLAADCERSARRVGLTPETRKYTPHVTMAYLTAAALDRVQAFEARLGLFQSEAWLVEGFHLYSSWGHKAGPNSYQIEADYPLSGSRSD